jgi:parvulin-like peptidyl-prolyl isomerase
MSRYRMDAPIHLPLLAILLAGLFCLMLTLPVDSAAPQKTAPATTASDAATSNASTENGDTKPAVVAVVNGQSISRQELAQQCMKRYGETVLESLVNKHLILQACQQRGIQITHEHIEQEIDRISSRFNLPKDRWLEMLQQERNISPEQYRRDIIWPTLALRSLAANKLVVTEEMMNQEFESEYGPKVQVRLIAVSDRRKAEDLLRQAKAAPDQFGTLAKQYSEDPNSAAARGLIPPIRRHIGDPAVEKVAYSLKPGEISPILEVANQYLILMCEKHLPAAHISPQYRQVANERIKERIMDRQLREASSELFDQLQSNAQIVNVYNDPQLRQAQPGVAATINGQQITVRQLAEECIARHGIDVLDSEINLRLLQQALQKNGKAVSRDDVNDEIGRAAEAYGYLTQEKKPDVDGWLKEITEQEGISTEIYIRDAVWPSVALKKLVADDVQVSQDDLQKGFEANYGERVEVLAIVLGNQRVAQEVWDMARSNMNPTFFGELAAQYSIEPVSRANLGEVPPIRRFSGQPKVEEEAFTLTKEDPLSAIVAVADKYVVMYYVGRTEPVVRDLEPVREELQKDLREKKLRLAMAQQFDEIREAAQIDNYLAGTVQNGTSTSSSGDRVGQAGQPARTSPKLVRPVSAQGQRPPVR